ncbi:unnamed protein product [Prunus armeniaca]|uniref:Uncharacterized protein n=1 Tax=Prunus armeniaca TaxID=36596 RepID=A0A6J5UDJ3_PRUAR|nr:unnamed protein product [Prunus armeniaca]
MKCIVSVKSCLSSLSVPLSRGYLCSTRFVCGSLRPVVSLSSSNRRFHGPVSRLPASVSLMLRSLLSPQRPATRPTTIHSTPYPTETTITGAHLSSFRSRNAIVCGQGKRSLLKITADLGTRACVPCHCTDRNEFS